MALLNIGVSKPVMVDSENIGTITSLNATNKSNLPVKRKSFTNTSERDITMETVLDFCRKDNSSGVIYDDTIVGSSPNTSLLKV